jgi:tetratricopeptide (TPR) repeat protein
LVKECGLMEDKCRLAELRHDDRQMSAPSSLKIIFCLATLAILGTHAAAEEDTVDYWMEKAGESVNNGSFDQAILAYDQALMIDSENASVLLHKAYLLNVVGKANASLESYEKALVILDKDLNEDPDDAMAWGDKAQVLSRLNRQNESNIAYEKAVAAFDGRTDRDPHDVEAWIEKAWILYLLGRMDDARAVYDKATLAVPESYMAWRDKAKFHSIMGEINESAKAYDRAIELIPANETALLSNVWSEKSEALMMAESWEEALAAMEKALELYPRYSTDWTFKAVILLNLNRDSEALEAYDEALKRNPASVSIRREKAGLLAEMKRYNESLAAYDEIIKLTDRNDTAELAQIWLERGSTLNETGRHDEAIDSWKRALLMFNEAIVEAPGDIYLMESKGLVLFDLGRYEEALEVYGRILEGAPRIGPVASADMVWTAKGDALLALGRNKEALEAYNKAIDLVPMDARAWQGRAEAQKALGQGVNAANSFYVARKLELRA